MEWGSLATVPGPLVCRRVQEWAFVLEADGDKLDALARKLFAEPSGGAVEVATLGHHVIAGWAMAGEITSETPPFSTMGSSPEATMTLWVPVLREKRLELMMAGIWLDNAISLPSGREMYGFPKGWGWPEMHPDGHAFALDVFGMDYGRGQAPGRKPLLRVRRGAAHEAHPRRVWSRLHDIAVDLGKLVGAAGSLVEELAEELRTHSFSQLVFRQIRAVDDGTKAALQQIVTLPYTVSNVSGGLDLHEYAFEVSALDSHPLAQELGLESQTTRIAMHVELDFTLGDGRVIWDAAG